MCSLHMQTVDPKKEVLGCACPASEQECSRTAATQPGLEVVFYHTSKGEAVKKQCNSLRQHRASNLLRQESPKQSTLLQLHTSKWPDLQHNWLSITGYLAQPNQHIPSNTGANKPNPTEGGQICWRWRTASVQHPPHKRCCSFTVVAQLSCAACTSLLHTYKNRNAAQESLVECQVAHSYSAAAHVPWRTGKIDHPTTPRPTAV
jgi:hypothetical protein